MKTILSVNAGERSVELDLPAGVYSPDSVRIAAHVFDRRAEAFLSEEGRTLEVALVSRSGDAGPEELKALGKEFLNELLNQEYRALVGRFNRKITDLVVTQALYSARGGETPPEKADESSPEFKADVERMLKEAEEEIRRTMPPKIPPQGPPVPPEKRRAAR